VSVSELFERPSYMYHVILDLPQTFKVNGSNDKVAEWYNVISSGKNALSQKRIAWPSSKLKIIAEASARCWRMFKVITGQILNSQ